MRRRNNYYYFVLSYYYTGSIIIKSSCGFDKKTYCFIVQNISFDLNKDEDTLGYIMEKFNREYYEEITRFKIEQSQSMLNTIEEEDPRFSSTSTVPANHSEGIQSSILSRNGGEYTSIMTLAAGGGYSDPELPLDGDELSSNSSIRSIHSNNESDEEDGDGEEDEEKNPLLILNQITTVKIDHLNSSMNIPYGNNNFIGPYDKEDVE